MEWKLDDSRPIWIQLQEQLTRMILSGRFRAGERLPSVRELASRYWKECVRSWREN